MKTKRRVKMLIIIGLLAVAFMFSRALRYRSRTTPTRPPQHLTTPAPTTAPVPVETAPTPVATTTVPPHPDTPAQRAIEIQDGQTIDFSSGRPRVSQTVADQAAMDAALAEMEAATAGVVISGEDLPNTSPAPPTPAGDP
ncbi:hypothetical protein [Synoicihabitans lomoniglobus]|uniref:Uncharacterized protein n=1 Tax=Synoicihabitans lomoniglobus TaxID=2909285 RepID=A0AAE9ZVU8_9BACT|nr:hypothetical protein [Opitutaceae bacterium LMO-M01]WED63805.1 hypothetical protein PXH66_15820 [Opitutaceae bacterium LMO-M01]